jgi:hypothetical protein
VVGRDSDAAGDHGGYGNHSSSAVWCWLVIAIVIVIVIMSVSSLPFYTLFFSFFHSTAQGRHGGYDGKANIGQFEFDAFTLLVYHLPHVTLIQVEPEHGTHGYQVCDSTNLLRFRLTFHSNAYPILKSKRLIFGR